MGRQLRQLAFGVYYESSDDYQWQIPDGATKRRNITAFMSCNRRDMQYKFYARQYFQLFEPQISAR